MGQESPGWGFRPPQAGPTPAPHLLGGLGWALLPPRVPEGRGGRPSSPEGSAGAGEGQQGSQPPAWGRRWSGRRLTALPGCSELTDDPGPLQSHRTAWESEVEGRPRQRLIASSAAACPRTGCQAHPPAGAFHTSPLSPHPSPFVGAALGGRGAQTGPGRPLNPAVSGPQARLGGRVALGRDQMGPRAWEHTGILQRRTAAPLRPLTRVGDACQMQSGRRL